MAPSTFPARQYSRIKWLYVSPESSSPARKLCDDDDDDVKLGSLRVLFCVKEATNLGFAWRWRQDGQRGEKDVGVEINVERELGDREKNFTMDYLCESYSLSEASETEFNCKAELVVVFWIREEERFFVFWGRKRLKRYLSS